MMTRLPIIAVATALWFGAAADATAQTFATEDPVLRDMWRLGMEESHAYDFAQTLMDSIGPRLTGSPGHAAGNRWLVETYEAMGIEARTEEYGEWMSWRRGRTHVDMVEPRVSTLEGTILAWSPGTDGRTVRGDFVILPDVPTAEAFAEWLEDVDGKYVGVSMGQPTCRPDSDWEEWATEETVERMQERRNASRRAWNARIERTGYNSRSIIGAVEEAGAAGIVSSRWSTGWGVQKIFSTGAEEIPQIDIACEDYGMLFRMAKADQHPVIEVMAEAEFEGVQPVSNAIAVIPGAELPDEYVLLSAHFDSWDGGTGATDNGTGTVNMLEAMRIIREAYPNPRRTILVGHWGGEEQGLNGSRAFAAAHPEIVQGMQALFNQDNGTGRVNNISGQGLMHAGEYFGRWLTEVPSEITRHIDVSFPGTPGGGGSDYASFICHGAPSFSLISNSWNYFRYTWHTNRDTFDKIAFDEIKNNATLIAMLVYLASEEEEMMPRERRTEFPVSRFSGERMSWPTCRNQRTWESYVQRVRGQ